MNENSLASIGFSIRNQVKGHFSTDDERIDIELIYQMIRKVRSILIGEQIKEQGYIDPELYQEICCLEIECRQLECNGVKADEVEYFVTIPHLETSFGRFAIKYLGTVDKRTPFNRKSLEGYLWGASSPWTGNKPFYAIVGDEVRIRRLPTTAGKYICLIAVLEDPLNGKCYRLTENDAYPISQSMLHKLELIIIKQLMSTLQVQPDERNNANNSQQIDNPVSPQIKQ